MAVKFKLLVAFACVGLVFLSFVACEDEDSAMDIGSDSAEDDDLDEDDDVPEVPEGMVRENMVKWSAPDVTEEEAHATRLPSKMKCDGCTAISYQLSTVMGIFHEKKYRKKGKKAPESEIIELVEKICDRKTFENYGLKSMNGVNRVAGPGTEAEHEPGMMQGGGRWPYRLSSMCGEIVGEADEYEIYDYIVENGSEKLFSFLCQNTDNDVLNSCPSYEHKDEL